MGLKSRRKGAAYEREIARRLSEMLGTPAKRRLGQARDAGHDIDIVGPYIIEAKRRKTLGPVGRWYAQARAAAKQSDQIPIVVMREDNGASLVVLSLDDFFGRHALAIDDLVNDV